jgi:hypothetical protein
MKTSWEIREAKRLWALNNPGKVKDANTRWRAGREDRLRRQARERMKRWRARRKSA